MRFILSSDTELGMEWSDENMKPPFCLSTGTFSSISASITSASFHLTALMPPRSVSLSP